MNNNLIIKSIYLQKEKIENFDEYPFNIEIIKNFNKLEFEKPVTFLIGENGVGKSTFIEAIAVALGLPKEGGTQNFLYNTKDTVSNLHKYLVVNLYNKPKTKFFLRAESFYNFQTEMGRLVDEDGFKGLLNTYGGYLHDCSHGESFIRTIKNRFTDHGIYILDEPEAALSPERQLSLLILIDKLVKDGSQFIIATHSPILTSYKNSTILDLNNNFNSVSYKDSDLYLFYKMFIESPDHMQDKLFE